MNWSKVSIRAGILGVPITIAWYLTHFALLVNWLPHGAPGALPAVLLWFGATLRRRGSSFSSGWTTKPAEKAGRAAG
jgi:uncharacterized protein (TIGR03382 family)